MNDLVHIHVTVVELAQAQNLYSHMWTVQC